MTIVFQTSEKIEETEFERIKSVLSEILGRYRVEKNQVHVTLASSTNDLRFFTRTTDSKNASRVLYSLEDFPYVPYPLSELNKAMIELNNMIKSLEFSSDSTIYRISDLVILYYTYSILLY